MIFTEALFLLFFVAVFVGYWTLRSNDARIWFLLGASLVFYGAWDARFLALLGSVILVTRFAALHLTGIDRDRRGQVALGAIVFLLALLGVFKYFNFFADTFAIFAQRMGLPVGGTTLSIVLPVGISFYIFQAIGLIIDAYDRRITSAGRFRDTAFFIAFFPQLVAGPIVRAGEFLPQIDLPKRLRDVPFKGVIVLFVGGWIKKAIIADNIGIVFVDPVFSDPVLYASWEIWAAVLLYAIQIYCDFSGYSEMAIATSRALGFQLPVNFRAPYLTSSLTDVWRRWHISLSNWVRDYVFIRMGGSSKTDAVTYRNLLITMMVIGLWHGAAWEYALLGYIWGTVLVIERATRWPKLTRDIAWLKPVGFITTFGVITVTWAIFRGESIDVSYYVLANFLMPFTEPFKPAYAPAIMLFLGLGGLHYVVHKFHLGHAIARLPDPVFVAAYAALIAALLPLVRSQAEPFIYFQF